MNKEKIESRNGMILTNGKTYGRTISLGANLKAEDFYEITIDEYNKILRENETQGGYEQ